jgi:twitching motility protein PilU
LLVGQTKRLAYSAMGPAAVAEFERSLECNMSYALDGIGRFRINVYQQRHETGMVARMVRGQIPSFESLGLPEVLRELALRRAVWYWSLVLRVRAKPPPWPPWWTTARFTTPAIS